MTGHPSGHQPCSYELRVDRHLDDHWTEWFENMALTRETDGTTTLRGPVADQAALHGLLTKIRDLGTTLLSVRALDHTPSFPSSRSDDDKEHDMTHDICNRGTEAEATR